MQTFVMSFSILTFVLLIKASTDQKYSIEMFTLRDVIGNIVVRCVKCQKNESVAVGKASLKVIACDAHTQHKIFSKNYCTHSRTSVGNFFENLP